MTFGTGDFKFESVERWAKVPDHFDLGQVVAVDTDSNDRVFVFNRGNHRLLIFEPDGSFVSCWGQGQNVQYLIFQSDTFEGGRSSSSATSRKLSLYRRRQRTASRTMSIAKWRSLKGEPVRSLNRLLQYRQEKVR